MRVWTVLNMPRLIVLIALAVFVLFTLENAAISAQTRLNSNSQVSPRAAIVVAQFSSCSGSGTNGGFTWDCAGLQYAQLKLSDGSVKTYMLIPTDPSFVLDSKWTPIPVTIPNGSTAVPCSQTKP